MNSNFGKKTFGVPRIANLENGNKFCIFKKITPGSSALYLEKKNESQLGAKWAKWAKLAKLSQKWAKWAKSAKFSMIFGGAHIDEPNI